MILCHKLYWFMKLYQHKLNWPKQLLCKASCFVNTTQAEVLGSFHIISPSFRSASTVFNINNKNILVLIYAKLEGAQVRACPLPFTCCCQAFKYMAWEEDMYIQVSHVWEHSPMCTPKKCPIKLIAVSLILGIASFKHGHVSDIHLHLDTIELWFMLQIFIYTSLIYLTCIQVYTCIWKNKPSSFLQVFVYR